MKRIRNFASLLFKRKKLTAIVIFLLFICFVLCALSIFGISKLIGNSSSEAESSPIASDTIQDLEVEPIDTDNIETRKVSKTKTRLIALPDTQARVKYDFVIPENAVLKEVDGGYQIDGEGFSLLIRSDPESQGISALENYSVTFTNPMTTKSIYRFPSPYNDAGSNEFLYGDYYEQYSDNCYLLENHTEKTARYCTIPSFSMDFGQNTTINMIISCQVDEKGRGYEQFCDNIVKTLELSLVNQVNDIEIKGVIGLDGSADQSNFFEDNKCKIVDTKSGKTLASCEWCLFGEEESGKICVNTYSQVIMGMREYNTQYVYMFGGEGGDAWVSIYSIDLNNGKFKFVDKSSYSVTGGGKESELFKSFHVQYYNSLLIRKQSEACEFPSELNPECNSYLTPANDKGCVNPRNKAAYTPSCFTNWGNLTEDQQKEKSEKWSELVKEL